MKARTTVILFGIFIILLIFVYLFEGPLSERKRTQEKGTPTLFPDFNKDTATKIEVKSTAQEVSLERKEEGWLISGTDAFTADPQLVNSALDTVANFTRENVASKNPEKLELFEAVQGKGVEVKISGADQKMLAHFYIGKSGPDFFSTYFRKEGSDEVLLAAGSIKSSFDRSIKNWRDKTIFSFPAESITQLTLNPSQEEIVLKKDEKGVWQIVSPEQAEANKEVVTDMVATLASLKASDFAANYNLEEHELNPPRVTITAILDDKVEKRLLIGKKDEDKSQYYVKDQSKKTIFLVGKYQYDKLNRTLQVLKEGEKKEAKQEVPNKKADAGKVKPQKEAVKEKK